MNDRRNTLGHRLWQSMEAHPTCPPTNYGRWTWAAKEMERVTGVKVSNETIRKWVADETYPRHNNIMALCQTFSVDPYWLEHGRSDAPPKEVPPEMAFAMAHMELTGYQVALADPGETYDFMAIRNHVIEKARVVRSESETRLATPPDVAPGVTPVVVRVHRGSGPIVEIYPAQESAVEFLARSGAMSAGNPRIA